MSSEILKIMKFPRGLHKATRAESRKKGGKKDYLNNPANATPFLRSP